MTGYFVYGHPLLFSTGSYNEGKKKTMSPAVSNVTQEPDVEQGSQLDPDMTAYGYDPTEEEFQVTSLKMD